MFLSHSTQSGIAIKIWACDENKDCQLLITVSYWAPSLTMLLCNLISCNYAGAIWSKKTHENKAVSRRLSGSIMTTVHQWKTIHLKVKKVILVHQCNSTPWPSFAQLSLWFLCSTASICKIAVHIQNKLLLHFHKGCSKHMENFPFRVALKQRKGKKTHNTILCWYTSINMDPNTPLRIDSSGDRYIYIEMRVW